MQGGLRTSTPVYNPKASQERTFRNYNMGVEKFEVLSSHLPSVVPMGKRICESNGSKRSLFP